MLELFPAVRIGALVNHVDSLHLGKTAYDAGELDNARDLLKRAVDQGAPSDEALVLLERLERMEGSGFNAPLPRKPVAQSRWSRSRCSARPTR